LKIAHSQEAAYLFINLLDAKNKEAEEELKKSDYWADKKRKLRKLPNNILEKVTTKCLSHMAEWKESMS